MRAFIRIRPWIMLGWVGLVMVLIAVLAPDISRALVGGVRPVMGRLAFEEDQNASTQAREVLIDEAWEAVVGRYPEAKDIRKDYLNRVVARGDVTPHPGEEVLIALNAPPEKGYLVVFGQKGPLLQPVSVAGGFSVITSMRAIDTGASSPDLMVEDVYDEMFGAFFRSENVYVLRWHSTKNELVEVWEGVKEKLECNPMPPTPECQRLQAQINFGDGRVLVRETEERLRKEKDGSDKVVKKSTRQATFTWNSKVFRFVNASQ